jgi:hypothetical protein
MSMVKIRQYVLDGEVETLKQISQNNVYSAWFDCGFGGCELGVFSAAMPVEALHAVEGGLCKDVAAILFKQDLKDAGCGRLDVLVVRFCSMDKQHYMTSGSNKAMPRILVKDGVTSLAKLPPGLLFPGRFVGNAPHNLAREKMVSVVIIPEGKIRVLFVKVQRLRERVHRMVVPFNGCTVHDGVSCSLIDAVSYCFCDLTFLSCPCVVEIEDPVIFTKDLIFLTKKSMTA